MAVLVMQPESGIDLGAPVADGFPDPCVESGRRGLIGWECFAAAYLAAGAFESIQAREAFLVRVGEAALPSLRPRPS